jgi:hypothetical protein
LHSLSLAIQPNQGLLRFGAFIASDGTRATIPSQVRGVLPVTIDSDELSEELSGRIAIFTQGRFLWAPIKAANQSFVFDEIAINTLKARGLSFEPMFTGRPDYWIGP